MPLTPEDVSNKRFTAVRLREGYDMGEVDAFLDEVEAELVRLDRENSELRTKLEAAQSGQSGQGGAQAGAQAGGATTVASTDGAAATPAVTTPDPDDAVAAQEATVTSLDKPGVETIRVSTTAEASAAATRLLELATRSADELLAEARSQADGIVTTARTDAERLEQEARGRVEQLDTDTAQRREQLFSALERDRSTLAGEVESLRTFEREYRAELKDYFAKQLDALEHPLANSERFGTGDPDPSGAPATAPSTQTDAADGPVPA